jgi:uncharacterized protein YbjT (DUF2867 family)
VTRARRAALAEAADLPPLRAALTDARQHGFTGDVRGLASWLDEQLARGLPPELTRRLAALSQTWEALEAELGLVVEKRKVRADLVHELATALEAQMQAIARLVLPVRAPVRVL